MRRSGMFPDMSSFAKLNYVGQAAACMPVTQQARVRSPVETGFLGEVFSGFFLTCKTYQEALGPQGPRISFGHNLLFHTISVYRLNRSLILRVVFLRDC